MSLRITGKRDGFWEATLNGEQANLSRAYLEEIAKKNDADGKVAANVLAKNPPDYRDKPDEGFTPKSFRRSK